MRGYFNTFLQITTIALVVLVLGNVGFDVIWNAAKGIFPSWGALLTFIAAMAGLSGLVFAWKKS